MQYSRRDDFYNRPPTGMRANGGMQAWIINNNTSVSYNNNRESNHIYNYHYTNNRNNNIYSNNNHNNNHSYNSINGNNVDKRKLWS